MHRALLAGAFVLSACGGEEGSPDGGVGGASLVGEGGIETDCGAAEEKVEVTSALHVDRDVDYGLYPPAGGDHDSCWGAWGWHEDSLRTERWVHNLEHGGVAYLHHCPDGCADELAWLRTEAKERFVVVTPAPKLEQGFAAIAWGYRLVSDCLDEDAFADFYDAHVGEGPETASDSPPPYGCD